MLASGEWHNELTCACVTKCSCWCQVAICPHTKLLLYYWPYSLCCLVHVVADSFLNWRFIPFNPLHLLSLSCSPLLATTHLFSESLVILFCLLGFVFKIHVWVRRSWIHILDGSRGHCAEWNKSERESIVSGCFLPIFQNQVLQNLRDRSRALFCLSPQMSTITMDLRVIVMLATPKFISPAFTSITWVPNKHIPLPGLHLCLTFPQKNFKMNMSKWSLNFFFICLVHKSFLLRKRKLSSFHSSPQARNLEAITDASVIIILI